MADSGAPFGRSCSPFDLTPDSSERCFTPPDLSTAPPDFTATPLRRADLRHRLQIGLLRHLVTVAEDVGSEVPAVAEKFRIPNSNATHAAFRASASEMLDRARANRDLLVQHGLSETMLDELDAA